MKTTSVPSEAIEYLSPAVGIVVSRILRRDGSRQEFSSGKLEKEVIDSVNRMPSYQMGFQRGFAGFSLGSAVVEALRQEMKDQGYIYHQGVVRGDCGSYSKN